MIRRPFPALLALTLVLLGFGLLCGCQAPSSNTGGVAKAAIIDQLHTLYPNQAFVEQITQELEDYGFQVDVYRGDAVTVDFYRKLPSYGYRLIIFRVHSGLVTGDVANRTWLFTSEPCSQTRYVTERQTDQVWFAAEREGAPCVFAISAKFITSSMKGSFSNTAIVMMGCSCLLYEDMAQAFIQEGASTYMGWDNSVILDYVDDATIALMEKLCSEELTIESAVAEIMEEKGPDPDYGGVLKYYPLESGDRTVTELIR